MPSERSIYHILKRFCPGCRRAWIQTEDGPVEVPLEHVQRIEGEAEVVEIRPEEEVPDRKEKQKAPPAAKERPIDRPNTPALVKKVIHRDGLRCAVPFCTSSLSRDHLQGHHVIFRSEGGRTEIWNELSLCARHHALVHMGLIEVEEAPGGGMAFIRKTDILQPTLDEDAKEVDSIPVVRPAPTRVGDPTRVGGSEPEAGPRGAEVDARRLEGCVLALRQLGFTKAEASERVRKAVEMLLAKRTSSEDGANGAEGRAPTDEEILRAAFSIHSRGNGDSGLRNQESA
jgi:hypothetical protein